MNWRDEAGGAAAVLVAVDASKEITDYALDWAVRNIIRPGDTLILVGLLKALSPPSPPMALSRLQPRRNQSGMNMLINYSRKGKKADEGSVSRISEACTEMMNEICFENNIKHVRTHVVVTLVPETHFGSVADKAEEYQASWLIIDRRLKKESENCLKQLNCNIILIDHAIPKILRMVDSSTEGERSTDTTDVFWTRNNDGSIGTSGGYSSFTTSGSLVSSSDMDSGELRHGMSTSCVISSPSPYKDFSSGEVAGRREYQPKASHVSFAKPPIAPTKGNSNSIGGTNKPLPLPPNRSPLHPAMRGSRELEAETKPPNRSPLHPAMRGIRELGADQTGCPSPDCRLAEVESLHCPVPGGAAAGIQIHRESPLRSRVLDHHKTFAKPSIPPNAGTMKSTSSLGREDGFTKGRSSVDSRSNSSTLPSDRSRQSFSSLLRMSSLKHIVDDELKHDPLQQLPLMDRTSSVRRAMSLTIKQPPVPPPLCSVCRHRAPMFGKPPRKFSYEEVERATDGFAEANYLAEGGYGAVYRGVLEDGLVVAVKQHKTLSAQGASEFCSEVEVLSCAQHRNLVMLVGYCTEREWMLLYEFSCNGSLDKHLYANDHMEEAMTWHHRQKVAVGAAGGLRYLHEDCRVGCIVHRDLRPNNILLTHDFEPMVGDFGLARWQTDGQKAEETRIVGAFGYLAPEYVQTGQLTEKADVYSFGVLLMELISGVKATDLARCTGLQNLSQWALPLMDRNMMFGLIDPRLKGEYVEHEVECMMRVAGLCISPYPELRPRMSKVLRMLEGEAQAEPILHKPSLRPVSMPLDTKFLTRTEKNNSSFSYDGHAQRQRGGISTIDEQFRSQNLRKPPIPQKKIAVGIDEMKMASNSPILDQSGNLASKKQQAHLEGPILEYLRRSRELTIQNAGLQY